MPYLSNTVYSKRNEHLIPFFVPPLGNGEGAKNSHGRLNTSHLLPGGGGSKKIGIKCAFLLE